ncbi:ACP S-malonyltransferase [Peredibacter starrii]|uniref:Malonyl CoA-acyl carrier protein transacylase n=1 Tax=Peredibacter starrii TaxID=28202 RepID=A0AAX4HSH0_9BACT|nr:ACP S-malonyltransferase [Peredibacter starrii]WPU66128.1 ACP S-malonyltransferase [Peredibacter starrii]
MKVTVVFPGQGTQYVGMGKVFSDFAYFEKANEAAGYDLKKIMLEGPAEDLKLTENTQPAIVAHSLMLFDKLSPLLKQKNITVERVLGHSVGEYAALAAAGAMTFEEAVKAVHFRGKYMQESVPAGKGTMYAILKQEEAVIREACEGASTSEEKVSPANFNEPSQIVISGDKPACERAIRLMEDKTGGRVKAIELQVSAPFHCALMKPAELKLKPVLDNIKFQPLKFNYIANIDAKEYPTDTNPETIKDNLVKQVCGSVLWTHSIQKLSDDTIIIECGPGKVLAGLIKKINPNLKVISLDSETGFSEVEAL